MSTDYLLSVNYLPHKDLGPVTQPNLLMSQKERKPAAKKHMLFIKITYLLFPHIIKFPRVSLQKHAKPTYELWNNNISIKRAAV